MKARASSRRAFVLTVATSIASAPFASCVLDTSGLTPASLAAGDAGATRPEGSLVREAGCSGVDAALCEDFDRPSALDSWLPLHVSNGGQLSLDSTTSASAPNALWARTPVAGPVPRTANVTRRVTLSQNGLAFDLDLLVDMGCASSLAVMNDDLASPYYALELVTERAKSIVVVENHHDTTTPHEATQGLGTGWSHVRCEVGFVPALLGCSIDGQRVLDGVAITPTRVLSGREVHVGLGINYEASPGGCSARIDNYVLTTW